MDDLAARPRCQKRTGIRSAARSGFLSPRFEFHAPMGDIASQAAGQGIGWSNDVGQGWDRRKIVTQQFECPSQRNRLFEDISLKGPASPRATDPKIRTSRAPCWCAILSTCSRLALRTSAFSILRSLASMGLEFNVTAPPACPHPHLLLQ